MDNRLRRRGLLYRFAAVSLAAQVVAHALDALRSAARTEKRSTRVSMCVSVSLGSHVCLDAVSVGCERGRRCNICP